MERLSLRFIFIIMLLMIAGTSFSKKIQWGEDQFWDNFMFKFQLPTHLEISEDKNQFKNSRYFIASDNVNYTLTIYAWKGSTEIPLTEKDVAKSGFDNYTSITEKEINEEKTIDGTNGIKFETIFGDGIASGKKVFFYVAGFKIEVDGSFYYCYVTFAWWDIANENPGFKRMSLEFLNKITMMKEKREMKQEWRNYSWEDFRIFFQLPGFLEDIHNELREDQSHYFSSSDNVNYTVTFFAWKGREGESSTEKQAVEKALGDYTAITEKKILETKQITNANNIVIETIYGVGVANDRKVYFLLTGFVLPNGRFLDSCYVTFAWWDLPDANAMHEKLSREIIDKIRFYKSEIKEGEGEKEGD